MNADDLFNEVLFLGGGTDYSLTAAAKTFSATK